MFARFFGMNATLFSDMIGFQGTHDFKNKKRHRKSNHVGWWTNAVIGSPAL
jgi:hypothetical protein